MAPSDPGPRTIPAFWIDAAVSTTWSPNQLAFETNPVDSFSTSIPALPPPKAICFDRDPARFDGQAGRAGGRFHADARTV